MQTWAEVGQERRVDPFSVVQQEVEVVSERLRHSVSTGIPKLKAAADYFFRRGIEGKRLRPTLIMLMSSALSPSAPSPDNLQVDLRPPAEHISELRRRQQRLAEIAELIHVASLLHDDVIDDAQTRRGVVSVNSIMGNKTAILAGDFLLARASVTLAALRNPECVELMSQVLEHLVSGEIMQVRGMGLCRQRWARPTSPGSLGGLREFGRGAGCCTSNATEARTGRTIG